MNCYYFAYGSNMGSAEMQAYCPGARSLGKARLTGWRLAFTSYSQRRLGGVADIVQTGSPLDTAALDPEGLERGADAACPLSPVWGVVWQVDSSELALLHAKEGYNPERPRERNVYDIVHFEVLVAARITKRVQVYAYEVVAKEPRHLRPNSGYMALLLTGAREHGFAQDYQEALAKLATV